MYAACLPDFFKQLEALGYSKDGSTHKRPGVSTPLTVRHAKRAPLKPLLQLTIAKLPRRHRCDGQPPKREDSPAMVIFHHPHIIIEDTTKRCRPFYKEFVPDKHHRPTLPMLNVNAPPGISPFTPQHQIEERARNREHHRYRQKHS